MIGRLNHVAIAVPDLAAAAAQYRELLGARVSPPVAQPAHGVTTVFIELPNTKIELLHPLGDESPIAGFLERHPGGRHPPPLLRGRGHPWRRAIASWQPARACWATASPRSARTTSPVLFLHPKDFSGTLIELEQA